MVAESGPDLVVVGQFRKRDGTSALHYLWYDGAAVTGERRFLTMTSGPDGTVLYLDGKPLRPDRYEESGTRNLFRTTTDRTLALRGAGLEGNRAGPCTLRPRPLGPGGCDSLSSVTGERHRAVGEHASTLRV